MLDSTHFHVRDWTVFWSEAFWSFLKLFEAFWSFLKLFEAYVLNTVIIFSKIGGNWWELVGIGVQSILYAHKQGNKHFAITN